MRNREMVDLDADRAGHLWLIALNYVEYQNGAARMIEEEDAEEFEDAFEQESQEAEAAED